MAELELQEDLLIEILSRLPVKVLIRFTCVCKHWLSIIRSPEFAAKHHLTRCLEFEPDSVLALFNEACSISIFSYHDLSFQTAFKFRPAIPYDPPQLQIYHRDIIQECFLSGPCNGLFLIQLSRRGNDFGLALLLWNPATRELFKLPSPGRPFYQFGFGFDAVANDYKVVALYDYTDGKIDYNLVYLYSLATNSWRQLGNFYLGLKPGILHSSNGRMQNWISTSLPGRLNRERHRECLLSFDMVDELFVLTPLPCDKAPCPVFGFFYQGSNHTYPTVYNVPQNYELHVWFLQGYGPTGFWNKQLNVRLPELHPTRHMVLWKEKEIVSRFAGTITSFNLATQERISLQTPSDGSIIAYTESLVSIAKFVRQPPTMGHSSIEINTLQQLFAQLGEEGPAGDQGDSSVTTMIHEMVPEGDDDNDDSSTDSAFLTPDISAFTDSNTVYIDYDTDLEFYPRRLNEVERLTKLPYCLREVNKPMIPNPCTF